ncbi:MAG TPA: tetratricopeptide repeat protein [Trebonia sp.]|nr:tetratricopeptide repeat protein [Trebonia sp.]
MSREARSELAGLPLDLATTVGRYLVAAELASEPEKAYEYAQAARHLASRIGVVREVVGIAAYRTERWAEALAELRAARRMTGRSDYLAVMADSERALGRLDRALEVVHSPEARRLPREAQIELRIVESGIRRDQGLGDAAVLVLQVAELRDGRRHPFSARLFYAYGEALLAAGRKDEARQAFGKAIEFDPDGETDAVDRLDEVDGVAVTVDDLEDDDDFDEDEVDEVDEVDEDDEDEDEDFDGDLDDEAEGEDLDDEAEEDEDLDSEDDLDDEDIEDADLDDDALDSEDDLDEDEDLKDEGEDLEDEDAEGEDLEDEEEDAEDDLVDEAPDASKPGSESAPGN